RAPRGGRAAGAGGRAGGGGGPRPAGGSLSPPSLRGARTPHTAPAAKGVFFGLTHETGRPALARAVLEGVAFAFADAQAALVEAGARVGEGCVIGGGSRGGLLGGILAAALGRPLSFRAGGGGGPPPRAARPAPPAAPRP